MWWSKIFLDEHENDYEIISRTMDYRVTPFEAFDGDNWIHKEHDEKFLLKLWTNTYFKGKNEFQPTNKK